MRVFILKDSLALLAMDLRLGVSPGQMLFHAVDSEKVVHFSALAMTVRVELPERARECLVGRQVLSESWYLWRTHIFLFVIVILVFSFVLVCCSFAGTL